MALSKALSAHHVRMWSKVAGRPLRESLAPPNVAGVSREDRKSLVPECGGTCGGISSVLAAQRTAWFPRDANLILSRTMVVSGSSRRPRQRQGAAGSGGGLGCRFELRLTETGVTWPDFDRFERFWKFWNVEKTLFPMKAESARSITRAFRKVTGAHVSPFVLQSTRDDVRKCRSAQKLFQEEVSKEAPWCGHPATFDPPRTWSTKRAFHSASFRPNPTDTRGESLLSTRTCPFR